MSDAKKRHRGGRAALKGAASVSRTYRMRARADAMEAVTDSVLDVALELFTQRPYDDVSLDQIADQAGVSSRTILRRFGSKESLFVSAMDRAGEEMYRQRSEAPVGDVTGAISNLVDHYERWGDNRLRMLAQEDRIPVIAEHVRIGREVHWWWVERTFAPLLGGLRGRRRKRRIATLVAMTDVYTWKILRRDSALSRAETERLLVELITNLGKGGGDG